MSRDPLEPPPAKLTPEGMILEELRAIRKLMESFVLGTVVEKTQKKGKKS